jgi:FkbM family methyltransferase
MHQFEKKIRRFINILTAKDFISRIDYRCKKERFGSEYGGWYISTENIDENSVIYSFGVGNDATFDLALIERYGLKVHAFDPTPKSIRWVKEQNFSDNFILHPYGLADFDGEISFFSPDNENFISHTIIENTYKNKDNTIVVPIKRLKTIVAELGHNTIDILKIDIEGAEYKFIDDLASSQIRPKQILVEFHHRFKTIGIEKSKHAIKTLRGLGYKLYSISDMGEEYSFMFFPE